MIVQEPSLTKDRANDSDDKAKKAAAPCCNYKEVNMEIKLTDKDIELIQTQPYDSTLMPNFESLKGCLVWKDERPRGLSLDAGRVINSLLVGRNLLHRGLTLDDHPINAEYCKKVWAAAQQQISNWPGFKRLTLSAEDRKYLNDEIAASFREDL